jgi:hypothetical protein
MCWWSVETNKMYPQVFVREHCCFDAAIKSSREEEAIINVAGRRRVHRLCGPSIEQKRKIKERSLLGIFWSTLLMALIQRGSFGSL